MEEKKRYKDRTQITFSLPLQLKQKAQDIIQKYNKQTNDDLNLSRFCVKSLNLGCNVFYAKTPVAFKEILDEIFLMNKNLDLKSRRDIARMAKDYFNMYFNLYNDYFKFKETLSQEKQKEWEKYEVKRDIPQEYFVLKGKKNEINK